MPFSDACYDDKTLALLTYVLDEGWRQVEGAMGARSPSGEAAARRLMALRIMAAADLGERDPKRLLRAALRSVESRFSTDGAQTGRH